MRLFGRERELHALRAADRALVTLWGPGGVGKTTLARAFAQSQHGVFADLAPARTRAEAEAILARALGVDGDALIHAASARGELIVADNAEQLDADGRALLHVLAKKTRVLVTSRDALGVSGEQAIEIAPLAQEDACALFADRASVAVDDDVRAIVLRLDAIPLAIELAAARVPLLGVAELRARLNSKLDLLRGADRAARHATLRATIAWSWELLEEADRAALVACATFEAPFEAALAEAVIGGVDALDRLERLRARALLHARGGELRLLEAVSDFAREDPRYATFLPRHDEVVAAHALPLAEDLLRGGAVAPALAARHADLEAAARRGSRDAELAVVASLSVTGPLGAIVSRETADERIRVLVADAWRALGNAEKAEALLAFTPSDPRAAADRERALGSVLRARGAHDAALAAKERALAAHRALDERALAGIDLGEIGLIHQSAGRLALARSRHAAAIAIHVAERKRRAEGVERSYLAVAVHRAGDPEAAIELHEAALAIHREVGHRRLEGAELLHLAFVRSELGEAALARQGYVLARATLAAAGARGLESLALIFAARLEIDEGEPMRATLLLAEAALVAPEGFPRLVATRRLVEGHLALSRGDRAAAAEAYADSLAASRDVEVGFEALTPAYLAFVRGEPGGPFVGHENPHLCLAWEILSERTQTADPASLRASSEVRRALVAVGARRGVRVGEEARTIVLPDGRTVDLARRKNVRLVLLALLEARRITPGVVLTPDALVAAGWPGERIRADAAQKRLHTAIWTLRSLGLEEVLVTREDGYFLDPGVSFERL